MNYDAIKNSKLMEKFLREEEHSLNESANKSFRSNSRSNPRAVVKPAPATKPKAATNAKGKQATEESPYSTALQQQPHYRLDSPNAAAREPNYYSPPREDVLDRYNTNNARHANNLQEEHAFVLQPPP